MRIWLDDERLPPDGWTWVRTVDAVVSLILAEEPFGGVEEISLDHDLGDDDNGTGYDVLLWIERELHAGYLPHLPRLHVHSANPPARKRMEAAIRAIERAAA